MAARKQAPLRGRLGEELPHSREVCNALLGKLVRERAVELEPNARLAFEDMLASGRPLTGPQAEWVVRVAERLGIDPAANLFTSLPVQAQVEHLQRAAAVVLPWEQPGYKKPMKPPGRT